MPISLNTQAPNFSLPTRGGEAFGLSVPAEAPTLLVFFTPNCSWCEVALPRFVEVLRHREDTPVNAVGIVRGESADLEIFLGDKEIDFPIALDESGAVMRAYGIERVPTLVLLDAEGIVARVYEGWTEQLPGILEQTLLAIVHTHDVQDHPLPDYSQVGNGCAPL